MGYKKTSSEVYAKAWAGYQAHCQKDGHVPLSQYCLSVGIKPRRLYEWLRRRKISVIDFQNCHENRRDPSPVPAGEIAFCEVSVSAPPRAGGNAADSAGEVSIELRSGDIVRLRGVSVRDVSFLMYELNARCDVGA